MPAILGRRWQALSHFYLGHGPLLQQRLTQRSAGTMKTGVQALLAAAMPDNPAGKACTPILTCLGFVLP